MKVSIIISDIIKYIKEAKSNESIFSEQVNRNSSLIVDRVKACKLHSDVVALYNELVDESNSTITIARNTFREDGPAPSAFLLGDAPPVSYMKILNEYLNGEIDNMATIADVEDLHKSIISEMHPAEKLFLFSNNELQRRQMYNTFPKYFYENLCL